MANEAEGEKEVKGVTNDGEEVAAVGIVAEPNKAEMGDAEIRSRQGEQG
ncbi:MAG: hypothetical protein NTU53_00485 [Planctomycetota bacterium]|nr:hypothetical protein [Planctomycetota bacterium]